MKFLFTLVTLVIGMFSYNSYAESPQSSATGSIDKKKPTFIEVYLTAKGTNDRLTKQKSINFNDKKLLPAERIPSVIVDDQKTFQTIIGIGGALTDASAETFYKLPKEKQDEIITAYFDAEKGIGYSLARTHINSCDFSSTSYAYAETPGDSALVKFTIEKDRKYRIPFIKTAAAKTGNALKLFASPWSPPAWMKTNNDMLNGGKLKPGCYKPWSKYYIKFFDEYKKEGISFWGLTVQNEPGVVQSWESCVYTAEDERNFVRSYLGPQLVNSPWSELKLMIWDHNRNIMYHRAATIFDDPEAAKYVWGTAFHWYAGKNYNNVRMVHDAFPDKGLLFSEGCVYPFDFKKINDWSWGEYYGESMFMDFNNFSNGWTDWNVLLDETGGPNHVKNFCYAPVIGDTRDGSVHYMNSFYYIGHFSKFIRPGAKRVVCSSTDDKLFSIAFINPDGKVATVVMNKTDNPINFNLFVEGESASLSLPEHAIMTCVVK